MDDIAGRLRAAWLSDTTGNIRHSLEECERTKIDLRVVD